MIQGAMMQTLLPDSRGMCRGCGFVGTRAAMSGHHAECVVRLPHSGPSRPVFRLHVDGGGPYWLDLDVALGATLDDLDEFLRAVWLECCGHLSEFSVGPQTDYTHFDPSTLEAASDQTPFSDLLSVGESFSYVYDLGSSTELSVHVEAREEVYDWNGPVRYLARNVPPRLKCSACAAPAMWVHSWDFDERTGEALLYCGRHGKAGRDDQLPVVNSPRLGVCAYSGGSMDDWPPAPKD